MSGKLVSRRDFLADTAAIGITLLVPGFVSAAPAGGKTFTILHTNDMHASFIGMGPASDYTPFTLNIDYVLKPFNEERLANTVRAAPRKARGRACRHGRAGRETHEPPGPFPWPIANLLQPLPPDQLQCPSASSGARWFTA